MIYFSNSKNDTMWNAHVGNSNMPESACELVYYAQADGDELVQAMKILGIESVPFRVFTFVGDDAKRIFMNWR